MCTQLQSILYLLLTFYLCNATMCCPYKVPTPTLTVYEPRGLEISIPDSADVSLVIFYVSINRDVTEGDLPYREYVTAQTDGKWILNKEDLEVNVGDVVHYRIFVRRRRRGYLHIGTPYPVTERVKRPTSPHQTSQTTTTIPASPQTKSNLVPTLSPTDCTLSLHTALRALGDAQKELEVLRADQEILKDLASKQPFQLHLSGLVTEIGEPKEVIKFVLLEKLDLKVPVHNVVKSGTTITFQVTTFEEKLNILKRAKENLKDSPNILISPA